MITIAAIKFFLKRFIYYPLKDHWRIIVPAIVLIIAGVWFYRACGPKPAKLDERSIQKAQQAIAKQDREEMVKILAESDTKEAEIDSNIKAIEQAREDAKKNYTGKTNQELAEELNRRATEP